MNIIGSALGHYEVQGDPAKADVLIGHAFGTIVDEFSVNHEIAELMLMYADGRPIIADPTLTSAFPDPECVTYTPDVTIANTFGAGGGTWATNVQAKEYMDEHDLKLAIMFGHARHIGRAAMQGRRRLGLHSVLLPGMPRQMVHNDPIQPFVRKEALWVPREIIGSGVLWAQDKL